MQKQRDRWLLAALAGALAACVCAAPAVGTPLALTAVATSGSPAPGTAPGVTFLTPGLASIDAAGGTSFRAGLAGVGVDASNDLGIWGPDGSGGLALVARRGDPAPGLPAGVDFGDFLDDPSAAAGSVASTAQLSGASVSAADDQILWLRDGSGSLVLVAREGDPAPGAGPGAVFAGGLGSPAHDGAGGMAFVGYLDPILPGPAAQGIWKADATGSTSLLARDGDTAPGTALPFDSFAEPTAAGGRVAFAAATSDFRQGIWLSDAGGGLALVAREGAAAPGVASADFDMLSPQPALAAGGSLAFESKLVGAGVTAGVDDAGLWRSDGSGGLELAVQRGDPAPGAAGGSFLDFTAPTLNGSRQLVFFATLSGTAASGDTGLWLADDDGSILLLAREGDGALDLPAGVVFDNFVSPVINARGQVVFGAGLRGAGVDASNDYALFAVDAAGALHLVVRSGDSIEVGPGDSRTLMVAGTHLGLDERAGLRSLNDSGELAVTLLFTDSSSGVFVAIVPEPGTGLLLGLGLALLARPRRGGRARARRGWEALRAQKLSL